jgi:hypothetical protein
MGKKKGKFKSGTWVERELFLSRAYLSLKGFAPQMLVLFLGKRDMNKKTHECLNKNNITMTYAELENIFNRGRHNQYGAKTKDGISRPRITRGFNDLMAKGFINIIRQGGAYQQDKTIYALTDDWSWWQPGQVIYKRPKDTRQLGYRNKKKYN